MKRHKDAIAIQGGACNPLAITNSLLSAIRECQDAGRYGTKAICEDAAVRLIAHQLAFLLNVRALDDGLTEYSKAYDVCVAAIES